MSHIDYEWRKCWIYKIGDPYTLCLKVFGGEVVSKSPRVLGV